MKPELLDLLKDAPPPRYGVEDAVAAGRRLRRKHRAGWAVAAVAVVLAAIGVPAIVLHRAGPGPAVDDSAAGRWPLVFTFRGYQAAGFRVDDPSDADLTSDTALIHAIGAKPGSPAAATLRVFHPGTDPVDRPGLPAIAINGRTGFFDDNGPSRFWWQYADGRYAVLTSQSPVMNHRRMQEVAEGFRIGATRPVVIGFSTERPPAGYVLVAVHSRPDQGSSGAEFQLSSVVRQGIDPQPSAGTEDLVDPSILGFRIDVKPWTSSDPASASCPAAGGSAALTCYRRVGDTVITATWTASTTGPLTAALSSTNLGEIEVTDAFPASARLTR